MGTIVAWILISCFLNEFQATGGTIPVTINLVNNPWLGSSPAPGGKPTTIFLIMHTICPPNSHLSTHRLVQLSDPPGKLPWAVDGVCAGTHNWSKQRISVYGDLSPSWKETFTTGGLQAALSILSFHKACGFPKETAQSREVEINILPSRYPCCYEVFLGKISTEIRRCWWKAYLGRVHSKDWGPWGKREVTEKEEDCHQTDLGLRPPVAPFSWASSLSYRLPPW